MCSVTTTTYLWGKHFNQLIQKPEFCYFIVKFLTAVIHTRLQHLQKTNQYQTETEHKSLGEFLKNLLLRYNIHELSGAACTHTQDTKEASKVSFLHPAFLSSTLTSALFSPSLTSGPTDPTARPQPKQELQTS